ncbi:MAG: TonB-dependent receptor [Flavobacteriales bacterium]
MALLASAFFTWGIQAQTFTVSGRVTDATTGEYILGANVMDTGQGKGVSTNIYGFYSVTLPARPTELRCTFIGYAAQSRSLTGNKNVEWNVALAPQSVEVDAVEVVGTAGQNTESTSLGKAEVAMATIQRLPALMGEVDVLKAIQMLPGIQSAGEGNSGYYVRGGGPDQNLLLLDNAAIYNASHLFGFFSVFNADAISSVEVYKGSMPARFGGRVSSVLDLGLKEGNRKELKGSGGVGLISSRLTLEGPVVEGVSSFIVSGRRTYIDVLTRPYVETTEAAGSGYYFYDLNAKYNHRFSDRDEVFVSSYFGRDVFSFNSADAGFGASIPWGNAMVSTRWNHVVNDKLFLNVNASYSNYEFAFESGQDDFEFGFNSGVVDWTQKAQLSWYPNLRHEVRGGLDHVFHEFVPTSFFARQGDQEFEFGEATVAYSHESGAYLEDIFDVTDALRVNAGVRYSDFRHVGPFTRIVPGENLLSPADTVRYGNGDLVKRYGGWEPRLSARLKTGPRSSLKAGWSVNYQYVHLASLSATTTPTDVWVPSSDLVPPQRGRQINAGYFVDLGANREWEGSIEVYHKDLDNLVEYAENTRPDQNIGTNPDNNLVFGVGSSYGAEFFLKRKFGELNGWVGYTWSKTDRQFDDLNNGDPFPAKFDRRHDLSVVVDWRPSDRWNFGAIFVYATGNTLTLPVQRYFLEGYVTDVYGARNGYRMIPYHRADVSATFFPKKNDTDRKVDRRWVFSVYNLYNRANPYFLFFDNEGDLLEGTLEIQAKQVSLFPILPSVSWNFAF